MSYRRTPRCGNCYKQGHTKVACPDLSSYMKERYKEIAKNRACKHCSRNNYDNAVGHNKRSCKLYREDREAFKKDVIRLREMLVELYNKHKVGVGTVVSYRVGNWRRYGKYQDVDTDILIVESMELPTNLSSPIFKCKSTITNEIEYLRISRPGIEDFTFTSCIERFNTHRATRIAIGYRERDTEILSDCVPGTQLIENMSEIYNEETIRYPDIME